MLKRTIKYRDLDDLEIEEEFYFHYSTAEATELKVTLGDDIQTRIQRLIDTDDAKEIVKIFRGLIADSVGRRSANGKAFLKDEAFTAEFMASDAYSEMLLWLLSDQKNMEAFVNGIFPANMQERVGQLVAERSAQGKTTVTVELPSQDVPKFNFDPKSVPPRHTYYVPGKSFSAYTRDELSQLTQDEFDAAKATL